MIWLALWLASGAVAVWWSVRQKVLFDGDITVGDVIWAAMFMVLGPLVLIGFGFAELFEWFENHEPWVIYRRKK